MTDTKFVPGVVDMTTASAALTTDNTLLRGVHVQTALSAQALELSDGSGGTVLFTVPASAPAGAWFEAGDMRFPNGIYVVSTAVTSGKVTINARSQVNWAAY
tara:strand:+ start:14446 stop:14751 length:306 start_codon:yes stop_codon:yes gene_type:complete